MQENIYKIGKLNIKLNIKVVKLNEPSIEALKDLNRTLKHLFLEYESKHKEKDVVPL